MELTRADFLKMMSLAAGAGVVGLPETAAASTAEAPPATSGAAKAQVPVTGGDLDSQRFRRAVVDGNAAEVKRYLERDPALALSRDEKGRSVLVLAWLAGRQDVVELLREPTVKTVGLDFVEAVFVGDMERIQKLGERFPNLVNEPHPFGGTPVHAAAKAGRAATIFALLGPGANFNAPSTDPVGLTPYRMAIEYPDRTAAEQLVDAMSGNGGDPNAKQGDGTPALHVAAAVGSTEILRQLILNGADVTARDAQGATALDVATRKGNREAAEFLRRADALVRNHQTSRFAYAAGGEKFEKKDNPPLPQPLINRYVMVSHGNLQAMKTMLANYPSLVNANASWDEMGIEGGAHTGFKDGVQLLLDQGAPMSICTASTMGRLDRVKALLAEDPKRVWEHGAHNMPVMWYPALGMEPGKTDYLEIAKLLLDGGADVNAHKQGQTALHWAAGGGKVEMVDLLLARGADPNAKRWQGPEFTALAMAEKGGHAAVVERLKKAGAAA